MSDYPKHEGPILIVEIGSQKYFLRRSMSLTVGRSNRNDIILDDPTVSRAHALIRWETRLPMISDLQSTSGVFVDDEKINRKSLSGLHSIKLGAIYLRTDLISSEGDCPTQLEMSNKFNREALLADQTDSNEVTLYGEQGSRDIIGHLADNKAVKGLLIHLEMSRRTGTLSIAKGSTTGILRYAVGKIRSARCGKYHGQEALHKICSFESGTFHFTININVGEASLCISPMCYYRERRIQTEQVGQGCLINSHDSSEDDA